MKHLPWAAGLIIVALAVAAVVLAPVRLRTYLPAELWGDLGHPVGRAAPAPPEMPPGAARRTVYVIEQVSPIVGADSTLAEALGFESPRGKFRTVLPKGTAVPVGRVVTFGTGVEDQKEIRLHVLRGRSEVLSEDHSLGWVRITELPPGPRRVTQVAVAFQVVDGAILLAAQNPADGRAFPIEASEAPPGFDR